MPDISLGLRTVGDYQFSISLPSNAFIREFMASCHGDYWTVSVATTKEQLATIQSQGRPMRFDTLDKVAGFLSDQGATELTVSLLGLIGGQANA
ncbi:hypothetical protein AVO42_11040 [Thiomicrospira sp. XS5]|uniref:hypothetical protein n=1 Tax=Thiomicrospira sp. XS5 TaxID=1775636 RepID=UPI00074ACDC1|nr:hypothetical protein [Thiomicrospira sp. XS5]KUJ75807.1 hypothetical protein AVO42_11040 [Thiomicrospira sp. XS5]